jgi:hypothetical protein
MNIADLIYQRRSESADPQWIADVLGSLMWLMDDNGAEIHEALNRWLVSGTHEQAEVALYFDQTFPYSSRDEMIEGFARLQARFPDLKSRCDEIVKRWDEQFQVHIDQPC